jgi:nucleoside-diphosphate-sugar epimerase
MNLLVTGASGFLGRNFLIRAPGDWRILALYRNDAGFPEFASRLNKPNLSPVRCDLADPGQVAELFERHGSDWDACLYLAAKVDIPWSVREPGQDLSLNAMSLLHLLARLRARRFVYFSSGAVYDGLTGEVRPDARLRPTLPYAISKFTSEHYVRFYCHRARSIENYLIVRFFGAYGPYEASHKIYTQLLRRFVLEGGDRYTIYGDGQNLIDAMYVEDAVEGVCRMLTGHHWNDTVNFAAGHPMTIEALVREVGEALGRGAVTIEKQGVAHESNDFWGSTGEMREHFGFEATTSLAAGITRFRDFFLSQRTTRASEG